VTDFLVCLTAYLYFGSTGSKQTWPMLFFSAFILIFANMHERVDLPILEFPTKTIPFFLSLDFSL
jgi:hypothetical protein